MQDLQYEVKPAMVYVSDDGMIVSVHGAAPWRNDAEKARWHLAQRGYTVYNPLTGQYGIGHKPWATRAEAQAFADANRPSSIGLGD